MNTCPSVEPITTSFQNMQCLEQTKVAIHSAPIQPKHLLNNGSLIKPELLDLHSNIPRSASLTHSPKHLDSPCHSHHEHQAQEMANLEQIWSGLSLGRSNDEMVTYVQIPFHPQTALAWD